MMKLLTIPIILIALSVHELAHGYISYKLGDPTAKASGRLSLNPLRHLDPIGALCMFLFGFGWARPVPINVRYFKNPKRDMALSALAGPVSNLILGFIGMILFTVALKVVQLNPASGFGGRLQYVLLTFLQYFYYLNISLAVFNFIPVPPLDGSRILFAFLPTRYYFSIMRYERYIMIGMLVVLWTGFLDPIISGAVELTIRGMAGVISYIPFL